MHALVIAVLAALSTACAASGARPQPFPTVRRAPVGADADLAAPGAVRPAAAPPAVLPAGGYDVSGTALAFRGTPYRNGGADPNGFDCSGLVWYVFAQHGLALPRTAQDQYRVGENIRVSDLQPGDLVFFSTIAPGPSHVGIVIGGDSFVHAPSSSGVVRVERLGASYWSSRFIGARRILQAF